MVIAALATSASAQTLIYVDADADQAPHDGSDWCHAYTELHEALGTAGPDTVIKIANGIYTPDETSTADPRDATFGLINGVTIRGGYAGCGAPDPDARDIDLNESILSGDLNGDDATGGSNSENCRHVVTASDVDASALLDGVTITAGNANGSAADGNGGGMLVTGGSPALIDCTFLDNAAVLGGGMFNSGTAPTLLRCVFDANVALHGGAIYNDITRLLLTSCVFRANRADGDGGVMYTFSSGFDPPLTLINCVFSGNSAVGDGGALFSDLSGLVLTNCTFSRNTAGSLGGGLYNYVGCQILVTNGILWGNNDTNGSGEGGQILNNPSNSLALHHTCLQGLTGGFGGVNNIGDDPLLIDAVGPDGNPGTEDDDLRLAPDSPCIDAGDNSVVSEAIDLGGNPRIVDYDGDGTATVDMGAYESQPFGEPIPTVSAWGVTVLAVLVLTAGTLILMPRCARPQNRPTYLL